MLWLLFFKTMRSLTHLLVLWFGVIMVLVVLVLAIALLTTDFYTERLSGQKRTLFIIILFAYAVYRSFRTYSLLKNRRNHED
jgi:EamA domain-containing membrane protein RarD